VFGCFFCWSAPCQRDAKCGMLYNVSSKSQCCSFARFRNSRSYSSQPCETKKMLVLPTVIAAGSTGTPVHPHSLASERHCQPRAQALARPLVRQGTFLPQAQRYTRNLLHTVSLFQLDWLERNSPALVIACLYFLSCTSPAANTPSTLVLQFPGSVNKYPSSSVFSWSLNKCVAGS